MLVMSCGPCLDLLLVSDDVGINLVADNHRHPVDHTTWLDKHDWGGIPSLEGRRHWANHSNQPVEEGVLVVVEFQHRDDQGSHWAVALDGMGGKCGGSPCPLLDRLATPEESVPPHLRLVTLFYQELLCDGSMRVEL